MIKLEDGLILYHGSYCEVKEPDLNKCAKRKDFGQGFYLTTSKSQAKSFLKTSLAKAVVSGKADTKQNYGYISTFEFKISQGIKVHYFESANKEWLHCIAAHRKKQLFTDVENQMSKYDIIVGEVGDDTTDYFCIKQLLPNKLKDQYCFKTEKAISCLKFIKGEKICQL